MNSFPRRYRPLADAARGERPIVFVGGLHRSGTSMLTDLIARHPQIGRLAGTHVIEDEGQFLQSIMPTDTECGGPGRFAFHPGFRRCKAALSIDEQRHQLLQAWTPHWPASASVVVEKSPGNMLRAPLLRRLFPGCRFVFIIRHPVAVSLATQKWSHTGIFSLMMHWLTAYERLSQDARAGTEHMLVCYEDLVRRPHTVLDMLWAHCGLEPQAVPVQPLADANQPYFAAWRQAYRAGLASPRLDHVARGGGGSGPLALRAFLHRHKVWLKSRALTAGYQVAYAEREAADAVAAFGPSVEGFGYSLSDLDRHPQSRLIASADCNTRPDTDGAIDRLIRAVAGR